MAEPGRMSGVWRGPILEGMAVLVGILVAFGIDAAWEERGDRATEQELLHALRGELIDAQGGFGRHSTFLDRLSRNAADVQRSLGTVAPDAISNDSLIRVSRNIGPTNPFYPPRAALDDLTGAGGIALVQSDSLRRAIAAYESALASDLQTQQLLQDLWLVQLAPYLYAHSTVDLSPSVRAASDLPVRPASIDRSAYLGNRTYQNLITARTLRIGNVRQRHIVTLEALARILELLDR